MTIDDGEPQGAPQPAHLGTEVVGAAGVQPARLVEQQQGVHDERAGQGYGQDHAARQIGRHAGGVLGLEATIQ